MTEVIVVPNPKEFWKEVDAIHDAAVKWVYEQCDHNGYQCCEDASWYLFNLLKKYFINVFGSMEVFEEKTKMLLRVAYGGVNGISHVWIMLGDFVYDPTIMQFGPSNLKYGFEPKPCDYEISETEW